MLTAGLTAKGGPAQPLTNTETCGIIHSMENKMTKLTPYQIKDFKSKLNFSFRGLRKAGYIARQNFMCCQTCAWAEIPDIADKVVFYHRQDSAHLPSGHVYMGWCGDGERIASTFRNSGLLVEWDGKDCTRILVKYAE